MLRTYFHAKDENRPFLLADVFSPDAQLEIRNRSDQISFPATTIGLEGIADALVRRFNQAYENIYSFYMDRPGPNRKLPRQVDSAEVEFCAASNRSR